MPRLKVSITSGLVLSGDEVIGTFRDTEMSIEESKPRVWGGVDLGNPTVWDEEKKKRKANNQRQQ